MRTYSAKEVVELISGKRSTMPRLASPLLYGRLSSSSWSGHPPPLGLVLVVAAPPLVHAVFAADHAHLVSVHQEAWRVVLELGVLRERTEG